MTKTKIWTDEAKAEKLCGEIDALENCNKQLMNRLFRLEKNLPNELCTTGRTARFFCGVAVGAFPCAAVYLFDLRWVKWPFITSAVLFAVGIGCATLAAMYSAVRGTYESLRDHSIGRAAEANAWNPLDEWTREDVDVLERLVNLEIQLRQCMVAPDKSEKLLHLELLIRAVRIRLSTSDNLIR